MDKASVFGTDDGGSIPSRGTTLNSMNSEQQTVVQKIADTVRNKFEGEGSGHDWWHIVRVWNIGKRISQEEGADMYTVELAALLHDIADWKFHNGDETVGPKVARELLVKEGVAEEVIHNVCDIISRMSFHTSLQNTGTAAELSLEGKVVQDADRLDAIGAIGIARAFAYGGYKNRPLHNPEVKPMEHTSQESYFTNENPTINHFYEKLLLLKDRMNTATAKRLAEERHVFMERYLEHFYKEWAGEL